MKLSSNYDFILMFSGFKCPNKKVKCADGLQCIKEEQQCNDKVDCNDSSDESAATCGT